MRVVRERADDPVIRINVHGVQLSVRFRVFRAARWRRALTCVVCDVCVSPVDASEPAPRRAS